MLAGSIRANCTVDWRELPTSTSVSTYLGPTQQAISYIWRNRLSLADRRTIKATAREIRDIAAERGIVSDDEPRLHPDEVDATEITDDQIMDAVEAARDHGLDEFDSERAQRYVRRFGVLRATGLLEYS